MSDEFLSGETLGLFFRVFLAIAVVDFIRGSIIQPSLDWAKEMRRL